MVNSSVSPSPLSLSFSPSFLSPFSFSRTSDSCRTRIKNAYVRSREEKKKRPRAYEKCKRCRGIRGTTVTVAFISAFHFHTLVYARGAENMKSHRGAPQTRRGRVQRTRNTTCLTAPRAFYRVHCAANFSPPYLSDDQIRPRIACAMSATRDPE